MQDFTSIFRLSVQCSVYWNIKDLLYCSIKHHWQASETENSVWEVRGVFRNFNTKLGSIFIGSKIDVELYHDPKNKK